MRADTVIVETTVGSLFGDFQHEAGLRVLWDIDELMCGGGLPFEEATTLALEKAVQQLREIGEEAFAEQYAANFRARWAENLQDRIDNFAERKATYDERQERARKRAEQRAARERKKNAAQN